MEKFKLEQNRNIILTPTSPEVTIIIIIIISIWKSSYNKNVSILEPLELNLCHSETCEGTTFLSAFLDLSLLGYRSRKQRLQSGLAGVIHQIATVITVEAGLSSLKVSGDRKQVRTTVNN